MPDTYLYGDEGDRNTGKLMNLMDQYNIACCSVFCSFPGQDWARGRETIGLTPPETRAERIARACRTADWAKELGINQIAVHVGYLPEDAGSSNYQSFIRAMRSFTRLLESNGQFLAYETGQEPLDLLLAVMADIGTDNQRINFDPANLLYYNNNDPMEFVERCQTESSISTAKMRSVRFPARNSAGKPAWGKVIQIFATSFANSTPADIAVPSPSNAKSAKAKSWIGISAMRFVCWRS